MVLRLHICIWRCCVFIFARVLPLPFAEGGKNDHGDGWSYTAPRGRSRYRQAAAAVAAAAAATGGGDGGGGGGIWGAGRRAQGGVGGAAVGGRAARQWDLETCTFTPMVIGARKGMGQAQQYLQVRHRSIFCFGSSPFFLSFPGWFHLAFLLRSRVWGGRLYLQSLLPV